MKSQETFSLCFADVPTGKLPPRAVVEFTFFWKTDHRWGGRHWQMRIN